MKKKILIHHHCTYHFKNNKYFTVSFIGHWINELSKYFDVGLLIHKSRKQKENNDCQISPNVKIHSLGLEGKKWDRISRIRRIKKICKLVSPQYDILLIRGITPRQLTINRNCEIKYKFFLLVGSLIDSRPKFKELFKNPYQYFIHYWRKFELRIISKDSTIFSNSPSIAYEVKKYLCINHVHYIPTNTISVNHNQNKLKEIDPTKPIKLLFCGRIERDKGIIELIDSLQLLNKKENKYLLTIVGVGSQPFMNLLHDYIKSKGMEKFTHFAGFIQFGNSLFEYYSESDIFVLPSYHEGFPHVIWEAAAMSTPVIVTNVGGIPGVISNNEAELINPRSSSEIVKAVEEITNDPLRTKTKLLKLKTLLINNTLEESIKVLFKNINQVTPNDGNDHRCSTP